MTIETEYGVAGSAGPIRAFTPAIEKPDGLFAGHLEAQMTKVENVAGGRNDGKADNKYAADIDMIKEKGLTAYYKELQAKKMEELREEILNEMGLSEEDLANMPPEQRADIEKLVAEEIQKRMAAMSMMNKDDDADTDPSMLEKVMPGLGSGVVFLNVVDEKGNTFTSPEDEEG